MRGSTYSRILSGGVIPCFNHVLQLRPNQKSIPLRTLIKATPNEKRDEMTGPLKVDTGQRILKGTREVFEAIVDPRIMARYFITSGSGRLETGRTVHWAFKDVGAELDVKINKVEADRLVSFNWAASGVEATVEISLEPDGKDATMIYVSESGWPMDGIGVGRLVEQSKGWVGFLCSLKAYMESGIDLRAGGRLKGAGKYVKK